MPFIFSTARRASKMIRNFQTKNQVNVRIQKCQSTYTTWVLMYLTKLANLSWDFFSLQAHRLKGPV